MIIFPGSLPIAIESPSAPVTGSMIVMVFALAPPLLGTLA
jgi:hypothetical protein